MDLSTGAYWLFFFFRSKKRCFFIVEIEHIFERFLLDRFGPVEFSTFFFFGGGLDEDDMNLERQKMKQTKHITYIHPILSVNHHYENGGSFWSMMNPY